MKKDVKFGPGASILLVLVWLVGAFEIVKWVIEGLF